MGLFPDIVVKLYVVFIAFFFFLSFSCIAVIPVHAFYKVMTIIFVWGKLELADPTTIFGSKKVSSRCLIWYLKIVLSIYIIAVIARTIMRFWSPCWSLPSVGACIMEKYDTAFVSNVTYFFTKIMLSIPSTLLSHTW